MDWSSTLKSQLSLLKFLEQSFPFSGEDAAVEYRCQCTSTGLVWAAEGVFDGSHGLQPVTEPALDCVPFGKNPWQVTCQY